MDISDIENEIESIEDDSLKWSEEKERVESKEQSIQSAITRLQDDIVLSRIINEHRASVQHEKEEIDEQLNSYALEIERIEQELNELIIETEASKSVISELESIGEDVEEGLHVLEERQRLIDESTERLQEVIKRLGLAEFHPEYGEETLSYGEKLESTIPAENTALNSLREYMYKHNYSESDYMTYSQDPEWRVLQKAAFPEYPLPPMPREEAVDKLGEYIRSHNYGKEDFAAFSKDPIWQELIRNAYPGSIPVLVKPTRETASGQYNAAMDALETYAVDYQVIKPYWRNRSSEEIVKELGGHDRTEGSCSSLAFAYAGNRAGFDVLDFRGGMSRDFFSLDDSIEIISGLSGVSSIIIRDHNDIRGANKLLEQIETEKEYYFASGQHAAIVRKREGHYEYLELQHSVSSWNGWNNLDDSVLKNRFGCKSLHLSERRNFLIDVDSLTKSQEFLDLLGYINTSN